jgi:uncharacterized protein YgbK (DUF1537 family)
LALEAGLSRPEAALRVGTTLAEVMKRLLDRRAWSTDANRDGLEIVLKGGQIGAADFFGLVRAGRSAR